MKIGMMNSSNKFKKLNILDKNCLRGTDRYEYVDEHDSIKDISVENNGILVATIEGCLSNEKAGLQIVRMKTKDKNLELQKEVLKEFTNYVWDISNMNHIVLAIHVLVDGSGMDCTVLERLGFVGISGIGSSLYTLINPKYMELVEVLALDFEASKKLMEYYDRFQKRKDKQLKQFEQSLKSSMIAISDNENLSQQEKSYVQYSIDYYKEAINSLGGKERSSKRLLKYN